MVDGQTSDERRADSADEAMAGALLAGGGVLDELRRVLLSPDRQQIAALQARLDELERRVNDKDALIATIAPVMSEAIKRNIRDARDEMIEALYPIIGQVVVRAVAEAIRNLARQVDARMRQALRPRAALRHMLARLRGVSSAELALREALPFRVDEVFLIHRQSGILLQHVARDPQLSPDSDLVSSMLVAIRDFAQDAFGSGREGSLDEIQYGERRILIEAAQLAYLAVVLDGIEPIDLRPAMRDRLTRIQAVHDKSLRHFQGDTAAFADTEPELRALIELSRAQVAEGEPWPQGS